MGTKVPKAVPEQVEQKAAANSTMYSAEEFAAASEAVFGKGISPDVVVAALHLDGKKMYTKEEAYRIVRAFADKEVK